MRHDYSPYNINSKRTQDPVLQYYIRLVLFRIEKWPTWQNRGSYFWWHMLLFMTVQTVDSIDTRLTYSFYTIYAQYRHMNPQQFNCDICYNAEMCVRKLCLQFNYCEICVDRNTERRQNRNGSPFSESEDACNYQNQFQFERSNFFVGLLSNEVELLKF